MNDKEQLDLEFQISQYLDGQLGDRQAAELEKRIQGDERLGRLMEQYAAVVSHVSGTPLDESKFDFDEQKAGIMRAVERKMLLGGQKRRRMIVLRPFVRMAAAAAAVMIVSVVAYHIFKSAPPPVEVVEVAVVRSEPLPTGEIAMDMKLMPMEWDEVDLASEDEMLSPKIPAGTVVVSFGSSGDTTADLLLPM